MELSLKQKQQLSQQQLQSIEILQLSTLELEQYLQNLAEENPVVDLEPPAAAEPAPQADHTFRRLEWLEDNDYQNRYYQRVEQDYLDPFYQVGCTGGLEETLSSFLQRQLQRLHLDRATEELVDYLIFCLDDDGYFRIPLAELSAELHVPLFRLASALNILRSLEPAGVGAESLSQCLELQLVRFQYTGPALDIVRYHLEALSRHHYREIAGKLSIPVEQVHAAKQVIQDLEPKPGLIFAREEQIPYIQPDIYVVREDGRFSARPARAPSAAFQINGYYRTLYKESEDAPTREYLAGKLRQAESVLDAMQRRESTLKRCAQAIVEHQQGFFHSGPGALVPLHMADIAQELEVHESTISRTIREKYLQCSFGVFPLRYFFSNCAVNSTEPDQTTSATAAKALLQKLVKNEDPAHPLSDQKIADKMALLGCPISRRTVAKYRDELNIPGTFGRKAR